MTKGKKGAPRAIASMSSTTEKRKRDLCSPPRTRRFLHIYPDQQDYVQAVVTAAAHTVRNMSISLYFKYLKCQLLCNLFENISQEV